MCAHYDILFVNPLPKINRKLNKFSEMYIFFKSLSHGNIYSELNRSSYAMLWIIIAYCEHSKKKRFISQISRNPEKTSGGSDFIIIQMSVPRCKKPS